MDKHKARHLIQDLRYRAKQLTDALQTLQDVMYQDEHQASWDAMDEVIDEWNLLINRVPRDLKAVKLQYLDPIMFPVPK